jgi:hypothetical protein
MIASERAKEKQASRDADEQALASGEKTREQLRQENGLVSSLRFRVNMADAEKLA